MRFFAVGLLLCVVLAQTPARNCVKEIEGTDPEFPVKAKYDLRHWQSTDFEVRDAQVDQGRNFTYHFRVCGTMTKIPTYVRDGVERECYPGEPAYCAYQINRSVNGMCLRLGDDPDNVEYSMMDIHDPTVGLNYKYTGGDGYYCENQRPRTFTLMITCNSNVRSKPDQEPVYENWCDYSVAFSSFIGCPSSCKYSNDGLCNGNGLCKFDPNSKESRCFCNKGWHGEGCTEEGDENAEGFTTATLILVIILVFLIAVEFAVYMMWGSVKSLRLDPNAYGDMAGADELA